MNYITLSPEERDKLLQLANHFYPEYDSITFCESEDGYANDFLCFYKNGEKHSLDIHWFEFVIMQLVTVVFNKLNPGGTVEQFRGHITQNTDPVDYLYDLFKRM